MIVGKEELDDNPWNILSIYDLQYFHCPSCSFIEKSKQTFVDHALKCHPEAEPYLFNIYDGSLDDVQWQNEEIVEHLEEDFIFKEEQDFESIPESVPTNPDFESIHKIVPTNFEVKDCSVVLDKLSSKDQPVTKNDEKKKKLKCQLCEKRFKLYFQLGKHYIRKHENLNSDDVRKCETCEQTFTEKEDLSYHMYERHFRKCAICLKSLNNTQELLEHLYENHGKLEMACLTCDSLLEGQKFKFKHIKNCNENYKCWKCSKELYSKHSLSLHLMSMHGEHQIGQHYKTKNKCTKCRSVFLNQKRFQKHVMTCNKKTKDIKMLKCNHCDEDFKLFHGLCKHMLVHHQDVYGNVKNNPSELKCEKCNETLDNSEEFHKHMLRFHVRQCPFCLESFENVLDMGRHLENNHTSTINFYACYTCELMLKGGPSKKQHMTDSICSEKYQCLNCGKNFSNQNNLWIHKQICGKAAYICDQCPKSYSNEGNLKLHISHEHEGMGKSVICSICSRGFNTKYQLETHNQRVHEKITNYQCEQCDKKFFIPYELARHIRKEHEKIIENQCDTCGNGFSSVTALRNHINSVHKKIKEFKCSECEKCFSRKYFLKAHFDFLAIYVQNLMPQTFLSRNT